MDGYHKPVLISEILKLIVISRGEWYIDGTVGDGGYSLEVLKLGGNIIGIDSDLEALERTKKRFENEGISENRFKLIQGNFRDIDNLVPNDLSFGGIFLDLGVSTMQLKSPKRGFSFLEEGPLDMRMDLNLGVTAKDLINVLTLKELTELFSTYGEEVQAYKFAKVIKQANDQKRIETTRELAQLLEKASFKRSKIHPATKVFQALRIAVNDELHAAEEVLPKCINILGSGGFLAVVSFHSLEDRIVKTNFRDFKDQNLGEVLTKKPLNPSSDEIMNNPASRSSNLRIFIKK